MDISSMSVCPIPHQKLGALWQLGKHFWVALCGDSELKEPTMVWEAANTESWDLCSEGIMKGSTLHCLGELKIGNPTGQRNPHFLHTRWWETPPIPQQSRSRAGGSRHVGSRELFFSRELSVCWTGLGTFQPLS